jgi:hypothetical protein
VKCFEEEFSRRYSFGLTGLSEEEIEKLKGG